MLPLDNANINWEGWWTTLYDLRRSGWVFTQKNRYYNQARPKDSAASHDYFYMRHPLTGMLARFKYRAEYHEYTCDFLTQETKRCKEVRLGLRQAEIDFSSESIAEGINNFHSSMSSNGRTVDFDSANGGSSPSVETTLDLLNRVLLSQGNCKKKKKADIINIEDYLKGVV